MLLLTMTTHLFVRIPTKAVQSPLTPRCQPRPDDMQEHIENLEHQLAAMQQQLRRSHNETTFVRRWRKRWQRRATYLESVMKKHDIDWREEMHTAHPAVVVEQ
jgi:predicted Co/Zn/Cd cation transporter (cation efflux family)